MEFTTLALASLLILIVIFVFKRNGRPAGSRPLPGPSLFYGITAFIRAASNNTLHHIAPEWAKQYGDLIQIDLLVSKVVFINDPKKYKELVKSLQYKYFTNDRPPLYLGKKIKDITFLSYSEKTQQKRTLLHNLLKFYGEGVGNFQNLMTTTLREFVSKLKQEDNNVDFTGNLSHYMISIIGILLNGDVSEKSEENLQRLIRLDEAIRDMLMFENETMLQNFPFLRHIPGRFKNVCTELHIAVEESMEVYFYDMKKTHKPDMRRGVVDELLVKQKEINAREANGIHLSDEDVKGIIVDVIAAGYLTTYYTLKSLFLQLINHPDVQEHMYKEISEVIGTSTPLFSHKKQMPYTEAVIHESLRHLVILPFMIPHAIREDFVYDGYHIPKGATFMVNNWYVHHNVEIWEDPWSFKPERYLDNEGRVLDPKSPLRQVTMPFGTGIRACPGENFARSRMFLIATTLLQHFQLLPPDNGSKLPSNDPRTYKTSGIIGPADYQCKLVPRH